jgi:hypothetical protein
LPSEPDPSPDTQYAPTRHSFVPRGR